MGKNQKGSRREARIFKVFSRKMELEDPELSGANSLLFLIRICEENGPGGSEALESKFLIVFNKDL